MTATGSIRAEPHVEIGRILEADASAIIDEWCNRARAEQPGAARLHHEALRNRLHGFLLAMGRGLSQAGERNPREHRDNAIEHGEQRWDTGWSITELVRDYQILQTVLLEYLCSALERPLGQRETMAIAVFINDAIAASIAAYVANRDHEIRALERTGVEALQEAYRRKDGFLAVVVHELRNPLSPISAAVQALTVLLPDADPRVQDAIKLIGRQSRHLAHILDDLTDLTGFAQGRLQLARQVVDLAEIIEQSLQACEHLLEARRHRLSVSVPRALIVDCDPTRMVQVIVNLLNNAAKYTPPGGEIFVTASHSDDVIEVRVRDTGIGIPPEKVAQVFDLYTRLTPASDQSPDGLGIGLALVKALVALHDGTVDCRSDGPGRGTEFTIRVPAYKGRDPVVHATPPQPRRSPALADEAGDRVRPGEGP